MFPLGSSDGLALFAYERRTTTPESVLTSSHITRDQTGDVVVVESAQFTASYDLLRFEATNKQAGHACPGCVPGL